jgi:kynurenine formamidase
MEYVYRNQIMNKKTVAAIIFASLSAITLPAHAIDIDKTAQGYIDFFAESDCAGTAGCDLNTALTDAITKFPIFTESLVAAAVKAVGADTKAAETLVSSAILAVGVDSPRAANILQLGTESGVNADNAIAMANGSYNECDTAENPEQCEANLALAAAIKADPAAAEALVAAAILAVGADSEAAEEVIATAIDALGPDSPQIAGILKIASDSGVDGDTVTAIAIASGVDATIASEATAAGATAATGARNTGGTASNAGGGGGGGGVSTNQ